MQYVLNIPKFDRLIHTNVFFLFACTTVNFSKIFASSSCLWELQGIWTFHNINREWPNCCLLGVAVQLTTGRNWWVTEFTSITVHMEHSTIFTLHYFYHTPTAFVVPITNPTNLIKIITTAFEIGAGMIKAIDAVWLSYTWGHQTSFRNRYLKATRALSMVWKFKPSFATAFPYKAIFIANLVVMKKSNHTIRVT